MADSYDLLAESIERVIRSDLPPPTSEQELAGAIDRIMLEEARAGELRLAYLRVIVVAPLVLLTLRSLAGAASDAVLVVPALVSVVWLVTSIALVVALRRGWYRRWVPHLMPLLTSGLILAVFVPSLAFDHPAWRQRAPEAVGYVTALCGFLSLSGALRLSRSSARTGTGLALVVFVVVALSARMDPLASLGIVIALIGLGLLSGSVTDLVRRVVTDEVAKVTLSRMYHEAEVAIDKAKAAIETREQMLKVVSHDLRNPLNTIFMTASLMLDGPLREEQSDHVKRIKRAGQNMNGLIQDLLDVAKLETGRVGIAASEIDVAKLIHEAHDMFAPLAREKSIALELQVAEGLPRITADPRRLTQVISNLVGNAIKFTEAGGQITIAVKPIPAGVQVSIIDTGEGIKPDKIQNIFGGLWQADAADPRGLGLGLTIVKGIIDAHGGRIWVESEVGKGTTFHFSLGTALPPTVSGSRQQRREDTPQPTLRA